MIYFLTKAPGIKKGRLLSPLSSKLQLRLNAKSKQGFSITTCFLLNRADRYSFGSPRRFPLF
jgi:hypothetical protein